MKKIGVFCLLLLLNACGGYQKTTVTLPDGFIVSAKVADTPQKAEQGLMFIKHLPPDQGMLFVFDQADEHVFWMKNTLIDLDIVFIAPDKTVTRVHERVPRSYTYTPDTEVAYASGHGQYVLELPAAAATQHKIRPGSRIDFKLPN